MAFSELAPNLEPDCLVWGNPDELRQVVENILQNAREAASENYTTRLNHRGSEVTLEVSDWGPGIPPEVEGLIFDPFFTTKPVGRGPGLGLWQARELARQHGGDLVLASPAQPTTFLLRLPAIGSFPDCAAEPTA